MFEWTGVISPAGGWKKMPFLKDVFFPIEDGIVFACFIIDKSYLEISQLVKRL